MLLSGFVERIGDSVALVSRDGSAHDPDLLMVEALDAMVLAAGADVARSEISIAVPAYWKARNACRRCATHCERIWALSEAAWRPAWSRTQSRR